MQERRPRHKLSVDDREAGTYSTPPEQTPPPRETRAAKRSLPLGLALIAGGIFTAVVVVILIGLAL